MNLSDKRVLIVNDDGIDGAGIKLLETIAQQFTDDVWVVAPDEERSGASHCISVSNPIRYVQRDERHFAVRRSPTSCLPGSTRVRISPRTSIIQALALQRRRGRFSASHRSPSTRCAHTEIPRNGKLRKPICPASSRRCWRWSGCPGCS